MSFIRNENELPQGFSALLAMNPDAQAYYQSLSAGQQKAVVEYLRGAQTGNEARQRTETAVMAMKNHTKMF